MRFLLISSLLFSLVLLLTTNAHADELKVGMVTEFEGIYCKTEDPAQRIAAAMEKSYETGEVQYHTELSCVSIRLYIRTLRNVPSPSNNSWNVGEVETESGQHYFIVTTLPIVAGPAT